MNFNVNLEKLSELKLTPNQYIFLQCLFLNVDSSFITNPELKDLETEGFIKITTDSVILREKGNKLFEIKPSDSLFLEFFTSYPIKVPNGKGGYRALRTKDTESKEAKNIKEKYFKIIKKPGEHEKILKGLKAYVKNEFPYLVGIEVFLNAAKWEKYCDLDIDEVVKGTENKTQL